MLRALAILFIISIFIPVEFHYMVGTLRIEPYRIVLALVLIYSLFNLKQVVEQADIVDVLLIFLIMLIFISFTYNHNLQKALESTGIYAIESLGAFYIARMYIKTPKEFYQVNMIFIFILISVVGFSVYESITHDRILHQWAKQLTGHDSLDYRLYTHYYIRFDILRATNLFAHPILYGTISALFFPFIILLIVFKRQKSNVIKASLLLLGMGLTLSSAPLLSLILQSFTGVLVKFWHQAKRLWLGLGFLALSSFMLINAVSNRGFFAILISYFTFNPITGYYRLLQWEYTYDDIINNPVWGIAYHDWTRPDWLGSNSVDSFWLLLVLQHGIIAGIVLLFASLYTVFHTLNHINQQHHLTSWMVRSWILAFMSMILIGFTVDFFGKLQPMFFFMLGAIGWARHHQSLNQTMEKITRMLHLQKGLKQ